MKKHMLHDEILHTFIDPFPHGDTCIHGTQKSLKRLVSVINNAIQNGESEKIFYINDGEGYSLHVKIVKDSEIDKLDTPYICDRCDYYNNCG
jgi:hypothetical protein